MKIVIAPDSFKGSLSALQLCGAVSSGIRSVVPDANIVELPVADGGEGTVDSLVHACGGIRVEVQVRGPLGEPVTAVYGILKDGTAVVEMAQASGLPLVSEARRNPFAASSYGTGELIRAALDRGCRQFLIGLGGSATNDGGVGMLEALGVRWYGADGVPLPSGGGALAGLAGFDASGMDPRLAECRFTAATDVRNPLCGPEGASAVFGPQKGATPDMTQALDRALRQWADVIRRQTGVDVLTLPGGGAAGGMGAGLHAFLGAQLRSGIDIVLEKAKFEAQLRDADLVITGEGRLDRQTLSGKAIAGICRKARDAGVPVVALCGSLELPAEQLDELGLTAAFSIVRKPCDLQEAVGCAAEWASGAAAQMMRLLQGVGRR
ncbi:glycerate kinase [Paenibacillus elgii]|uniref:glycerate kinase n=1 Tax=Paenibacillus elgii TaxID=189691 RepID=UPI0013D638DB|nr:glycerate kinase [Paenibacillus elgii]